MHFADYGWFEWMLIGLVMAFSVCVVSFIRKMIKKRAAKGFPAVMGVLLIGCVVSVFGVAETETVSRLETSAATADLQKQGFTVVDVFIGSGKVFLSQGDCTFERKLVHDSTGYAVTETDGRPVKPSDLVCK